MLGRFVARLDEEGRSLPLHPFLFAAYPALLLSSTNVSIIRMSDVGEVIALLLMVTGLALVLLSLVWRDSRLAAVVVTSIVASIMFFERIYGVAGAAFGATRFSVLLVGTSALVFVVLGAMRRRKRLGPLNLALNAAGVVLVSLTIIPISDDLANEIYNPAGAAVPSPMDVSLAPSIGGRDIWYLVFDRYGSSQSIKTGYGIEQNDLLPWLEERGFQIVADSHANYIRTSLSLAAVLNMRHLSELANRVGSSSPDQEPVFRMLESNEVSRLLVGAGYEYTHLGSWYPETRHAKQAQRELAPPYERSYSQLLLRQSALPFVLRQFSLARRVNFHIGHRDNANYQFSQLEALADEPGPKFVYAHVLLPHPPYVFLANGRYAPRRATYETQLLYTNKRIRDLVDLLLARSEEERPIIILQADEGPYPERYEQLSDDFDWRSAPADDVEMKFGILNAMYLPGAEGHAPLPDGLSSVNTFRTVFRRYFDLDLPDLPDRSFASTWARPYDFIDVTPSVPPT
jgi:hypothetical protein